LIKQMSV